MAAWPPDSVVEDRETSGLVLSVGALDGELFPGERLNLRVRNVRGIFALGGEDKGPSFGADEIGVQSPLVGMRPAGIPAVRVQGGRATPLP